MLNQLNSAQQLTNLLEVLVGTAQDATVYQRIIVRSNDMAFYIQKPIGVAMGDNLLWVKSSTFNKMSSSSFT